MICRIWRGWTTPESADAYEAVVRHEVIPAIEARRIDGLHGVDLMRRRAGEEIEFLTLMWFEDLEAVRRFVGAEYETAHVPPAARAVLRRFDERSAHYDVLDRREA